MDLILLLLAFAVFIGLGYWIAFRPSKKKAPTATHTTWVNPGTEFPKDERTVRGEEGPRRPIPTPAAAVAPTMMAEVEVVEKARAEKADKPDKAEKKAEKHESHVESHVEHAKHEKKADKAEKKAEKVRKRHG